MKWILILVLGIDFTNPKSIATAEFDSEMACIAAGTDIQKMTDPPTGRPIVQFTCSPASLPPLQ